MIEIELLWAQDRNGAIGKDGALPWQLPEDLARFKTLTMGCPVIMGRKTLESLPGGKLWGRRNIVLSRTPEWPTALGAEGVESLDQALEVARAGKPRKICVIGGAQLYAEALPLAKRIYMTEVDVEVADADAFAPAVPEDFFDEGVQTWQTSVSGTRYRFRTLWKKDKAPEGAL